MPEELLPVIGMLALGFLLMLIEIFVPGGVIGILGLICVAYGCYLAFGLSTAWGLGSVALSLVVTVVAVAVLVRSRAAKKLVLDVPGVREWKATEDGLVELEGKIGRTLTPLRPAGLAEIDDQRIDVVADSEFLAAGVAVRVCEVEGNRVVVEAVTKAPATAEA
ncbi:MAG: hypothetical protein GY719_29620 [bacterium]|nr:hypothetical protein [bacterium]